MAHSTTMPHLSAHLAAASSFTRKQQVVTHGTNGEKMDGRSDQPWYITDAPQHAKLALKLSDTVEYRHDYLTQPSLTKEDRLIHAMNLLTCALTDAPAIICETQLQAIQDLKELFSKWKDNSHPSPRVGSPPRVTSVPVPKQDTYPLQKGTSQADTSQKASPQPSSPLPLTKIEATTTSTQAAIFNKTPMAPIGTKALVFDDPDARASWAPEQQYQPVAQRTRSNNPILTPAALASLLTQHALPVLDEDSGEYLKYRQLIKHPKLGETWRGSSADEYGNLLQGIGTGSEGPNKQRVAGTDTFRVTKYEDIPQERRREICHVSIVCEYRPQKDKPNHTRITLAAQNI